MKVKLILARTVYNPVEAWVEYKCIDVDIPLEQPERWSLSGTERWKVIGQEVEEVYTEEKT